MRTSRVTARASAATSGTMLAGNLPPEVNAPPPTYSGLRRPSNARTSGATVPESGSGGNPTARQRPVGGLASRRRAPSRYEGAAQPAARSEQISGRSLSSRTPASAASWTCAMCRRSIRSSPGRPSNLARHGCPPGNTSDAASPACERRCPGAASPISARSPVTRTLGNLFRPRATISSARKRYTALMVASVRHKTSSGSSCGRDL